MKLLLVFLFLVTAAVNGIAQTCERTLTVGGNSGLPQDLDAADFEASLYHRTLTITKVEPIRQTRLLILVRAIDKLLQKKSKQLVEQLEAVNAIPEGVTLAYGIYAEKIIFSSRFTSEPEELRTGLEGLVKKANSGVLGRRD